MPLDRAKLGNLASEQMEALEAAYGEDDAVSIGAVMTIVEILHDEGEGQARSEIRTRFTDAGDPYRMIGLMRAAEQQMFPYFGAPPGV